MCVRGRARVPSVLFNEAHKDSSSSSKKSIQRNHGWPRPPEMKLFNQRSPVNLRSTDQPICGRF